MFKATFLLGLAASASAAPLDQTSQQPPLLRFQKPQLPQPQEQPQPPAFNQQLNQYFQQLVEHRQQTHPELRKQPLGSQQFDTQQDSQLLRNQQFEQQQPQKQQPQQGGEYITEQQFNQMVNKKKQSGRVASAPAASLDQSNQPQAQRQQPVLNYQKQQQEQSQPPAFNQQLNQYFQELVDHRLQTHPELRKQPLGSQYFDTQQDEQFEEQQPQQGAQFITAQQYNQMLNQKKQSGFVYATASLDQTKQLQPQQQQQQSPSQAYWGPLDNDVPQEQSQQAGQEQAGQEPATQNDDTDMQLFRYKQDYNQQRPRQTEQFITAQEFQQLTQQDRRQQQQEYQRIPAAQQYQHSPQQFQQRNRQQQQQYQQMPPALGGVGAQQYRQQLPLTDPSDEPYCTSMCGALGYNKPRRVN